MDLFPYILVREAGISKTWLEELSSFPSIFQKNIVQSEDAIRHFQNDFLNFLNQIIAQDESPSIRLNLINIRRAVTNQRKIKSKDLSKITTHSFKEVLLNRVAKLQTLQLDYEQKQNEFYQAYEQAQLAEAADLFAKKENEHLQNGLLFSSPEFLAQLEQTKFDKNKYNKKSRQTFLKLLEYYARASFKTSPFSSFGKIGFYDLNNRVGLAPNLNTIIYTNNNTNINSNFSIGLNPTIFEDETYFYFFIIGDNHGEALTRLPKDETTHSFYESIQSLNSNQQLIQQRIEQLPEKELMQFLESGLLIKVPVQKDDTLIDSINNVQSIGIHNIADKKVKIENLKSVLKQNGNETPMIYEDCFVTPSTNISKSDFEKIANDLNHLTQLLAPLHFSIMRATIKQFCKAHLEYEEAINLVELIQAIKELPDNYLASAIKDKKAERQLFQMALKNVITNLDKQVETGTVKISFNQLDFAEKEIAPNYFASHFQVEEIDGQPKAIINSIANGAGKLFGRFAIQYPSVTDELKKYIYKNTNGFELILNQDFSDRPVNLHPPIIDKKIASPTSIENSISPGDLYVSVDSTNQEILLTDKEGTPIKIINLGVESETTRNYLYPYLSAFTGTRCVISPFLEIINNLVVQKKNEVYQLPRIQIGDYLILQRKSWHFPVHQLPLSTKGEQPAAYFLKIQKWIRENQLPNQVFIKTSDSWFSNKTERTSKNDHKPQFIDFTKIGFVLLFRKRLNQVSDFLELSETLPRLTSNNNRVKEYAMEWFS